MLGWRRRDGLEGEWFGLTRFGAKPARTPCPYIPCTTSHCPCPPLSCLPSPVDSRRRPATDTRRLCPCPQWARHRGRCPMFGSSWSDLHRPFFDGGVLRRSQLLRRSDGGLPVPAPCTCAGTRTDSVMLVRRLVWPRKCVPPCGRVWHLRPHSVIPACLLIG